MTAPTHQSATLPQNIAFDKWADIGFTWQGDVPVTALPRLAGQVIASDDLLSVALTLARQDKILWLTYDVKAMLSVACQRCLDPMPVDVSGNYRMAILESENKIGYLEALDETADYVLLDEICPDDKKILPVADMLEDELLLAIPLSPRHDDCDMHTDSVGDVADEPVENPFAVLGQLKGKLSG
ncbi:YceD family protein [Moraxella equi]|uniref:Large ribosomal RNA subunit accumulation protein YceD n=1 Tax=Moraxella equi TaxID=60442 RepID=A0A378QTY7_9GAMM|nr:YceD family protein [Moraxella equi]OPH40173.1 hypothetical protein B5J93_00380 [Moraxella equi]STZ04258.1 Uncharacterized ACR, COG1399 [Moraxella equi]